MFGGRKRLKQAMQAADGMRPPDGLDPADVAAFEELSALVRESQENPGDIPAFDEMWAGVEARLDREEVTAEPVDADSWFSRLLLHRPSMALAPLGAALMAVILFLSLMGASSGPENFCYVDSYDAGSGIVLVDQDFDDPSRPTVIWYEEEGG